MYLEMLRIYYTEWHLLHGAKPTAYSQMTSYYKTAHWYQIRHATLGRWSRPIPTGLMSSGSVYCVAHAEQKLPKCPNFDWIYIFGDCCTHPLPIQTEFGRKQWTKGVRSHAKFHLNPFIVSPCRDEKPQFLANSNIGGGLLYTAPFTDNGKI